MSDILQQSAFTGENRMLKGGLHCHTTRSDGKGDPVQVMARHKEHGYDFLAITDHRRYNRTDFAPEMGLTIVPGMELDYAIPGSFGMRCYHTVCIGPDDASNQYADEQRFDSREAPAPADFQKELDKIHAHGNMTILCHPQWSGTGLAEWQDLRGSFAMEVWNTGCVFGDEMDANDGYLWDLLLDRGVRLYGVATDDGHAMDQHCHGWVMVNAQNNVPSILEALSRGAFYASCGPVITNFYVEGNEAHVETEGASTIKFCCARHPARMEVGRELTSAVLPLHNDYPYIRAEVIDEYGRRAWTNPIFLKET